MPMLDSILCEKLRQYMRKVSGWRSLYGKRRHRSRHCYISIKLMGFIKPKVDGSAEIRIQPRHQGVHGIFEGVAKLNSYDPDR